MAAPPPPARQATRLFLAIPTHSETITTATAGTVVSVQRRLLDRGDAMDVHFCASAVIAELRNLMLRDFMNSRADAILMLDSDQGAPADLILKMIDSGHLVCGCMYPKRSYDWDRVPKDLGTGDMAEVLRRASTFVGRLDAVEGQPLQLVNGFAPAVFVGAGVLVIRREAVAILQARFPELEGHGVPPDDPRSPPGPVWGLFNPVQIDDRSGPIQEDYAFCHRWRVGCGQTLWAEVATPVVHVGRMTFRGSFVEFAAAHGGHVAAPSAVPATPWPVPAPDPAHLLESGAADRAWQALLSAGPVMPSQTERVRLGLRIAQQRGDWSTAAALANARASSNPEDIEAALDLLDALIRCGGLGEARALARLIARSFTGQDRLRGLSLLADTYAQTRTLRERGARLHRWLARRGAILEARPTALIGAASQRLATDVETRCMRGDVDGALAQADRWLASIDSTVVEAAKARALIEAARPVEALDLMMRRVEIGGADWRTLMLAAWSAGEVGQLDGALEHLSAGAPGVANEADERQAYAFVRACAAYGRGDAAAAIVADGLDPALQPAWLAAYLGEEAPEPSRRRLQRLTAAIAPPVVRETRHGLPVHVICGFDSDVGGAEGHAFELAEALTSRTNAQCRSLTRPHPYWRARSVVELSAEAPPGTTGGVAVIVGSWLPLRARLAPLRPDRVVIVYNTFHAPGLEALVEDVIGSTGIRPELMFVSPLMQSELGLPGAMFPSMTDVAPYLAVERDYDRAGFTIGRLSRDTADKQRLADATVLKTLMDEGAEVSLVGAGFLARAIGPHPRLRAVPAKPGIALGFLGELDVFFYRTGLWVEPCARVVFEAMASGLPVVLDRRGGISTFLTDGKDAFLVGSDDEALDRLRMLRDQPELRRRLGEAARETARRLMDGDGLNALLHVFAPSPT